MKKPWLGNVILAIISVCILLFLFILFYSDNIFNNYFDKYILRFNKNYNAELIINSKNFSFPNHIELNGVSLISKGDTILKVDNLSFNIRLLSVFKRDPAPSNLYAENIYLNIIHTDSLKNYLIKKEDTVSADTSKSETGFNNYINLLFRLIFDKIPPSLSVKDINVNFTGNYGKMIINIPIATIDDKIFSSDAVLSDDKHIVHWQVRGKVNSGKESLEAKIKQLEPGMNAFAGVITDIEMITGFDSVFIKLNNINRKKTETSFSLNGTGNNMRVFHHRLAKDTITVSSGGADLSIIIKQNELVVENPSKVVLDKIHTQLNTYFNNNKPVKTGLILTTGNISSQDFFNSLPAGMFETLNGIETTGDLKFNLEFAYDFAIPDSVLFDCILNSKEFKIKKMGTADLRKMNGSFLHKAYERGRLIRSFVVGPENPDFVYLDYISPYLKNSILTSEDGGFYSHRGFNEEAFKNAIVENIKKRRFARGGSTITMQLVKNVYLSRDKVISRKVEEALLVWLIENQRLVSKHRMFEVYLNIIEWGPGIYGVAEASRYYFAKHPSALTLAESIFLASIVPRPKLFRYSFDEFGNLRGYLEGYYRLLAGIMLRRGQITQTEYDSLTPHIVLHGPAREIVLPTDSSGTDPWLEENGENSKDF